ncbi:MAG: hypothetical protein WKF30_08710 [Pyrinomonadaceae bacterium]
MQRGLDRLYDYQHSDGGWGWWKNDASDVYDRRMDGSAMAARVDTPSMGIALRAAKSFGDAASAKPTRQADRYSAAPARVYALESGEVDARHVNDLFNIAATQPYGRVMLALVLHKRGDTARARQVIGDIESSARANESDAHWNRASSLCSTSLKLMTQATAFSVVRWRASIRKVRCFLKRPAGWSAIAGTVCTGFRQQTSFAILGLLEHQRQPRVDA